MSFKFQIKIIIIFLFLFTGTVAMAQQLTLSGQLKEKGTNLVLPSGGLRLTGAKDTIRVVSDASGAFSFHYLKPGRYRLIGSYIGFMPDTLILQLKRDTSLVVLLKSDPRLLDEVKVSAKANAVTIRHDTVAFNTQAYVTPPNATVEELLRRLPGMRIDASGSITFQGRKVDKVLINGRSFFISDLLKATRGLPADIIAHVEVSNSQSDENKLANISEMSDTKTINLKLKKDKSNGWLGKSFADYGTGKSYAAGGDISHLDSVNTFSATGLASNIGDRFTGSTDDEPAFMGKSHAVNGSALYQRIFSKKLTLNTSFRGDYQNNEVKNSDFKTTYLGDSTLISKETSGSSAVSHNYIIEENLVYKIDDHTTLQADVHYDPSTTLNNSLNTTLAEVEKMQLTDISSSGTAANTSSGQNNQVINDWTLTHRFAKEHRALIFRFATNTGSLLQQAGINTQVFTHNPADTTIVNQQSRNSNPYGHYTFGLIYNEPLGKKTNIRMGYGWSHVSNHSLKQSDDYNIADGKYDIPDTLTSNQFKTMQTNHNLSLMLGNLPGAKLQYEVAMRVQSVSQQNQDLSNQTVIKRNDINMLPEARLNYTFKQGEDMNVNYHGSSELPMFEQLQPVPDLTNPYLIKVGNPGLVSSYTHNVSIEFNNFNSKNSHNLALQMGATLTENPINETSTVLPGGVQRVQYVNTAPDYRLTSSITYDFPMFGQDHGNSSIDMNFNYGHSENIVNGLNSININRGALAQYQISYNAGDKFFADATASLAYVNNSYSLAGLMAARSLQQHYVINLTWQLPLAFSAKVHYNHQFISNNGIPNQQMNFLTASLAKDILGGHACQVRLSGYNLLNTQSDVTQSSGPNYIEVSRGNIIQKLILLSFVYHFENLNGGGIN